MQINVGDTAKDTITGFEGVVVARTEWLNGCARLTIQPRGLDKDGKVMDSNTFDEAQLQLVAAKNHEAKRDTGGPRPEPVRNADPR